MVPSDGLPEHLNLKKANNNLDLIQFQNKFYLAFRNSTNHFASRKARIIVISTVDLQTWQHETTIHLNNDLREPRFFEHDEKLFLYFFEGGNKMLRFEPNDMYFVFKSGLEWTEPLSANLTGFVPWRVKKQNGLLYMSAYYGKDLYKMKGDHSVVHLFTSFDGISWTKISEKPQLSHEREVSESEFIFDSDGNLWGVARLEMDGSYTFFASKDSIHHWRHKYSEYKYDSPIIFEEKDNIFLVARRNMYKDGKFLQFPGKPKRNLLKYSLTKKKTAIFKLDKIKMEWVHLKDFRSTGDTAFPAITKLENGNYLLMNYSSNIEKREKNWICGQLGKTYIYSTELKIMDCP